VESKERTKNKRDYEPCLAIIEAKAFWREEKVMTQKMLTKM
jgi:hypothetical protein